MSEILAWCMKCKAKKPFVFREHRIYQTKHGKKKAAVGKCSVCGTSVSVMVKYEK